MYFKFLYSTICLFFGFVGSNVLDNEFFNVVAIQNMYGFSNMPHYIIHLFSKFAKVFKVAIIGVEFLYYMHFFNTKTYIDEI